MKASELRIGNYVMDRGGKVLLIDHWEYENKISEKRVYGLHPFTEFVEYLQPIPLTEEWLLKFGFIETEKRTYEITGFKDYVDLCITIGEDKTIITLWSDDPIYFRYNPINVHQLQNLYFALTGEELTIK